MKRTLAVGFAWLLFVLLLSAATSDAGLGPEIENQLKSSKYVYVASTRKDGSFG